jgi:predicted aminopeptidase
MIDRLRMSLRRRAARRSSVRGARRRAPEPLGALLVLVLGCLLSGCMEARYLAQASAGQMSLLWRTRGIEDAVADVRLPLRTRALLREVASIKRFGERMGLTPTDNYRTYVDLDRPAAVWVVSACAPLHFSSKTWSFPIVGTVPYLGWFDRKDATAFAAPLRAAGWDVDVRGAGAYSTLGWLEDPVLSTMIREGEDALGELANVVLHESLHATLYLSGQTRLNESLANFVGDELAKEYLDERLGPSSVEKRAYLEAQAESEAHARLLHEAYVRLSELYASPLSAEQKREEKRSVLAALAAELGARRPLNNATLVQFRVYNSGSPALRALLSSCGGSWPRFLGALRRLSERTFSTPQEDVGEVVRPLFAACR